MNHKRIIIFAKAPEAFRAKTRLIPALGAEGAAQLARHMLQHTLHEALASGADKVELCMAPDPTDPAWKNIGLPSSIICTLQGEGTLGERLARASARALEGGEEIFLIGTDCPALDASMLRQAIKALDDKDAVVIPAMDGGYVLLGLKRFAASIFEGIAWSTSAVLAETMDRIAGLSWSLAVLPALPDIDEPADLQHLPKDWCQNRLF
jgi:rSAM/selenodomain-associated transferase 1